ncbi:hypothetical protein PMZ80_005991 [Knufia obscura]|uniref:Transposase n=1 Tax=Knufia obscura TaxID=1635080 RepID=A0ABR0RP68_9EURO|nr:hypothetical protein PMZ80_005991 [Knufia obscura]
MLTLPSSRKFIYPALFLLAIITVFRLLVSITSISPTIDNNGLRLRSSARTTYDIQLDPSFNANLGLEEQFTTTYHNSHPIQPIHPHVHDLLSKCTHNPNPHTNHIRLPTARILNISMVPSAEGEDTTSFKNKAYFNPALIPLPSSSPHPYLLISRLVTTGSHQESHVCFADVCSPPTPHPASDTRICTDDDLEVLGSSGGMRCVTKPERVNIPPTPARRCSGAWSTFPDIPGFHDPRVFWSGRGEVLVEVNSGSAYGCVGLWVVDLRGIWTGLEGVLDKRGRDKRDEERQVEDGMEERKGKGEETDLVGVGVGPRMGYSRLTESTRNPRGSRNEVEKNWVLFFPREGEAWVQYDVMGRVVRGEEGGDEVVLARASSTSEVLGGALPTSAAVGDETVAVEDLMRVIGLQKRAGGEEGPAVDTEATQDKNLEGVNEQSVVPAHGSPALKSAAFERLSLPAVDATPIKLSPTTTTAAASYSNTTSTMTTSESIASASPADQPLSASTKGGRTIAQLLSHGFTTPNLTSPHEPSCFNLTDHSHEHDILNNTGHWHQGSNSLRLILCTREQFRARSCLSSSSAASAALKDHKNTKHDAYEKLLINEGLVVHISIIHHKFSNPWKLPMRTLGVSAWPVLFGDERARPWSWEEDLGFDLGKIEPAKRDVSANGTVPRDESDDAKEEVEEKGHRSSYFTYTPSIAWAWRGKSEDESIHRQRGHEDLGTGYLGDEIVVGIGMDDVAQGYVKVKVDDVLGCMRQPLTNIEEDRQVASGAGILVQTNAEDIDAPWRDVLNVNATLTPLQQLVVLCGFLCTCLAYRNVPAAEVAKVLTRCQQDRTLPLFAWLTGIGLARYLYTPRATRGMSGLAGDCITFEDAFRKLRPIPMSTCEHFSILQGFLRAHYEGTAGELYVETGHFYLLKGSRRGYVVQESEWSTIGFLKPGSKIVMAVYLRTDVAKCPTCESALVVSESGEFFCTTCERYFRDCDTLRYSTEAAVTPLSWVGNEGQPCNGRRRSLQSSAGRFLDFKRTRNRSTTTPHDVRGLQNVDLLITPSRPPSTASHSTAPQPPTTSRAMPAHPRFHTDEEWERVKQPFYHYYIEKNLPLREVAKRMKERHGFDATKRPWDRRTGPQKWNFQKYANREERLRDIEAACQSLLDVSRRGRRKNTSSLDVQRDLFEDGDTDRFASWQPNREQIRARPPFVQDMAFDTTGMDMHDEYDVLQLSYEFGRQFTDEGAS